MKTSRRSRKSLIFGAGIGGGILALALASSTVCLAQSTAPVTTYVVTYTQVKPEMLNEWLDLQRNEVIPALKKAGVPSREVRATVAGENYEYATITPAEKFASLDGPGALNRALGAEAAARLIAKLRKCISSQRTFLTNTVNEISILPDPKAPPLVIVTNRDRITPGREQDYENYIKTDLLPVYKKAKAEGKIAGYTVSRRGLGANNLDRTQTTYYNKFAGMDTGPTLTLMLGQAAAQKLLAKRVGMATRVEQVVRRRVADLSF